MIDDSQQAFPRCTYVDNFGPQVHSRLEHGAGHRQRRGLHDPAAAVEVHVDVVRLVERHLHDDAVVEARRRVLVVVVRAVEVVEVVQLPQPLGLLLGEEPALLVQLFGPTVSGLRHNE